MSTYIRHGSIVKIKIKKLKNVISSERKREFEDFYM